MTIEISCDGIIHGNEMIILFLTRHFMSLNTQFR